MAAGTRNYDVRRRTAGRDIIELKSEKHQEFNKKKQTEKKALRVVAGEIDYTFLFIVILVLAAGLVMLLSASAPRASEMFDGNSYYFFNRQFIFAVAGVVGMWIISRINYKRYIKYVPMMFVGSIITLILVAIPHVGTVVNGARRWLFVFQPSEVMKPVLVLMFAKMLSEDKYNIKTLRGVAPYIGIIALVVLLLMLEPHLSGAIIIAGIGVVLLVAAGMPVKPIIAAALPIGAGVVLWCKIFSPVRWARLTRFFDPFGDMQGSGYQITQSLYAIGSGKLFGLGLGESVQKYSYLPEPYNDFIFAIVCEELGFIGATLVVALFAALIIRGMRIALNAPDKYSTFLATGIVAQVAIQTALNIAVATSSIPNTGVSLPFFSYGGTSLMTLLFEMGILLNISRYSDKL